MPSADGRHALWFNAAFPAAALPAMPSLWMIVASFLFACMGVCVKLGTSSFSTGELVLYRGLIGIVLMAVVARVRGTPLATPNWRLQLSRGVSGSIALMCYFFALGVLPLATAVTLSYTSPIFVALLLVFWFGEPVRRSAFAAILIGFAGIALLLRPTLQPEQWTGAAAGLAGGLLASLAYLSVRELGRAGEPEVRTVFWFSSITAMLALPWALAAGLHLPDPRGALILLGVGLFGGAAQLAMTRSYRYGRTVVSANLSYSTVVFSSLFGVVLWHELLPAQAWAAIVLIIASGIMVSLATARRSA